MEGVLCLVLVVGLNASERLVGGTVNEEQVRDWPAPGTDIHSDFAGRIQSVALSANVLKCGDCVWGASLGRQGCWLAGRAAVGRGQ